MSCTDPEFAESMRRRPQEPRIPIESPYGAEELEAVTAPILAMKELADAIAGATHGERVKTRRDRRDVLENVLEQAWRKARALNPNGVSGLWIGLGMPFRYGRPHAGVCLDCGWVGRVMAAQAALAEVLDHHC